MGHPSAITGHLWAASLLWVADTGIHNTPPSTLGSQLTDGDFLECWFWQSDQISWSNFMPAAFDGLIYYTAIYLWLYCNENHLCLVSLPLKDHLQLILLIAPRGSAGDFLEMFISTNFMCGFPCSFLASPWKDVSPTLVKVEAIHEEMMVMGWGLSPFLFQKGTLFTSLDHASLCRPGEAVKACVQSVFLTQLWGQQRDKPGCVRHT